jgi:hypothetical protein
MLNFIQAPYWSRHWIAQEVYFSEIPLVLYGTNEVGWDEVLDMDRNLCYTRSAYVESSLAHLMYVVTQRFGPDALELFYSEYGVSDIVCAGKSL